MHSAHRSQCGAAGRGSPAELRVLEASGAIGRNWLKFWPNSGRILPKKRARIERRSGTKAPQVPDSSSSNWEMVAFRFRRIRARSHGGRPNGGPPGA